MADPDVLRREAERLIRERVKIDRIRNPVIGDKCAMCDGTGWDLCNDIPCGCSQSDVEVKL
jgi:hypothetical protein